MSIIGIDLGSSTIKIIEYENNKILNSKISESKDYIKVIDDFIKENNINNISNFVLTGINAKKVNLNKYNVEKKICRRIYINRSRRII